MTYETAEKWATTLTHTYVSPPFGCVVFQQAYAPSDELLQTTPVVFGPFEDWDGDTFAVYAVPRDDKTTFYAFVWFPAGYTPLGYAT